jgi:hypothetical protein
MAGYAVGFTRTGKSLRPHAVICRRCPAPPAKIFLFFRSANQPYDLPSHPEGGALRNVINAGRGAVAADGAFDEGV